MITQDNFAPTSEELQQLVAFFRKHYGKPCYSLVADVNLPITPTTSRIGGLPYWDFSRAYPVNDQGETLRFLCQFNLAQLPDNSEGLKLLPHKGLLQFFLGRDDTYGCTYEVDNPGCKVVYWSELAAADEGLTMDGLRARLAENGVNEDEASNLSLGDDDYWPVESECAIKFVAGVDYPHIGDDCAYYQALEKALKEVFDYTIPNRDIGFEIMFDILEDNFKFSSLLKQDLQLSEEDAKVVFGALLGHPDFTQCNPLEGEGAEYESRFDIMLLRLDDTRASTDFEMMWGDCGIADFFMGSKALAQRDFSDIYYTWDCC